MHGSTRPSRPPRGATAPESTGCPGLCARRAHEITCVGQASCPQSSNEENRPMSDIRITSTVLPHDPWSALGADRQVLP